MLIPCISFGRTSFRITDKEKRIKLDIIFYLITIKLIQGCYCEEKCKKRVFSSSFNKSLQIYRNDSFILEIFNT